MTRLNLSSGESHLPPDITNPDCQETNEVAVYTMCDGAQWERMYLVFSWPLWIQLPFQLFWKQEGGKKTELSAWELTKQLWVDIFNRDESRKNSGCLFSSPSVWRANDDQPFSWGLTQQTHASITLLDIFREIKSVAAKTNWTSNYILSCSQQGDGSQSSLLCFQTTSDVFPLASDQPFDKHSRPADY